MTARDVAEYLLRLSDEEANDITNLKLQKLVYYVQGFSLAAYDEKLFDEPIQAWRYGPVVADLYHYYKDNGSQVIFPDPSYEFTQDFTPEQEELMKEVNNIYGQYSGVKLMHLTHEERPWMEAQEKGASIINTQTMQDYFKEQLIEE
ncbi:Panacea domain-containing protein [Hymenobacter cheonanensis]|uniref:Panacea domain-containing protein n=1 Tax=Hymenobacter sp. CA2-7 TaxID=3063993 RepID=UPI002712558B|nr:type II toxin-antitoxin system antitoxin SocA domain-containing protein [Hymenobacter sp. CA2-7]MDO7884269.1 DUF4065 domain-containing protein [Hymenobacter sp. CA2-7]